ncbi:MAG: DUF1425 domain-containing protein [Verrucomicrobiota bacterium]
MKFYALFLIALSVLFAGCASSSTNVDYKTQRLVITDPKLEDDIEVELKDGMIGGSKVLQANITNRTRDQVALSYRVEWFNQNGILVNDPETKSMTIAPRNIGFVKAQQPDPTAVYPRIVIGP